MLGSTPLGLGLACHGQRLTDFWGSRPKKQGSRWLVAFNEISQSSLQHCQAFNRRQFTLRLYYVGSYSIESIPSEGCSRQKRQTSPASRMLWARLQNTNALTYFLHNRTTASERNHISNPDLLLGFWLHYQCFSSHVTEFFAYITNVPFHLREMDVESSAPNEPFDSPEAMLRILQDFRPVVELDPLKQGSIPPLYKLARG